MATKKRATSYRLSDRARENLAKLKEKHDLSEAAIIEMALARMARVDLAEGRWPPRAILDAAVVVLTGKEKGKD